MADIGDYKFLALNPDGDCEQVGVALPVVTGSGVTETTDPVTGRRSYDVAATAISPDAGNGIVERPNGLYASPNPVVTGSGVTATTDPVTGQVSYAVAAAAISTDAGNTLTLGGDGGLLVRANMRLVFRAHFSPPSGYEVPVGLSNLPLNVGFIDPAYSPLLVDNLLRLPPGPHVTVFTRLSGSTELNTLLGTNPWQVTKEQSQTFAVGVTRSIASEEGWTDGPEQAHVALPGCRINNTSGSPITVSSGISRIQRQRMMQVQCYKVEV